MPLSAFAAVMYAALLHTIEALILLGTHDADGSVGMHALLGVIPDRHLCALALVASSVSALAVVFYSRLRWSPRLICIFLAPQQALLFVTALAAWFAVWHGTYADGVQRSSLFITADQLPRGMFSLIHITAVFSLSLYYASRRR